MSQWLFFKTWTWWTAGIGLGLTGVLTAWVLGKRLGITTGVADACAVATGKLKSLPWSVWFIFGLPIGGFLARGWGWHWDWLYGRMDALTAGDFLAKIFLLFVGGFLIGLGGRLAGGCTAGHSLMGMGLLRLGSFLNTVVFLAAGCATAHILWKVVAP